MLEQRLIPAQDPNSRWLMLVLHGLGDSMEGYTWLSQALDVPNLNYLLVNAPDDYFGGFSWYDYEGDASTGIERSVALLSGLLDSQSEKGFPASQTFVFGFSQGCLLAMELALRYHAVLAGCIGISGYLHQPEAVEQRMSSMARQQRLLLTHGTVDPLIPFYPVKQQVARLQNLGLRIEWREFHKAHTIAGEEELAVIREFVSRCL